MSEIIFTGMGLTPRMKAALDAITTHVGLHGVMPSRSTLASAMGCSKNNAVQLINALVERGELNCLTPGGVLSGFGRDGIAVFVPAHLAASLAAFCAGHAERIPAVVADAIALHLDALEQVAHLAPPSANSAENTEVVE